MRTGEDVSLDLMDQAVAAQDLAFETEDLLRWFAEFAPEIDPLWVDGRISGDTVNDPQGHPCLLRSGPQAAGWAPLQAVSHMSPERHGCPRNVLSRMSPVRTGIGQ
jgi:hypothetical protein